ncbi:MAG TPA: AAA family ATPase, partial [Candidatus Binatia bacterium]|nr:AAA family ATPase [Candidatus Binatia bacterium]
VWPGTYVSEGLLRGYIRDLRRTLGDDAGVPRFIETVARRGYRFIAPLAATQPVPSPKSQVQSPYSAIRFGLDLPLAMQSAIDIVGREAELRQLHSLLEKALGGERRVVFVTGEPGIGKTTVVEAFLLGVGGQGLGVSSFHSQPPTPNPQPPTPDLWVGRGQCIEHHGAGEAYLPVLEALGRLCRGPGGERLIGFLGRHAPTWLAQMPALMDDAELEALQRRVQGATRERMLREMAEAVEALTAESGLILWLEDLQWSDYSTLDLIAALAQRREPARLLLIGTYRPADVIVSGHPLKAVKQDLQLHGQCEEVALRFLTAAEISQYLEARFGRHRFPPELGRGIHQSTDGNPLFMVNVANYLVAQGVIREAAGRWQLQGSVEDVTSRVPESLRQLIEKQVERLATEEQRVLEAASVAGAEFSAAAVATGLGEEVERIEAWCEGLAHRGQFLRSHGTKTLPDGTVTGLYSFLHALYQKVLYDRLAATRRIRLHRRIGEGEEVAYGGRVGEIAAELAVHFERGQDDRRAVQYLGRAAENALRRSAHREAIDHLTKGLDLLKTLPDTAERAQQELMLQIALGAPLVMTRGYAAPEVERTFARARELCQQIGGAVHRSSVLWGLWMFYLVRAELQTAQELGEQGLTLAQRVQDPKLFVLAHHVLGLTLFFQGRFTPAQDHLEQGLALFDPQKHPVDRSYIDPELGGLLYTAHSLWYLGYPDQALQRSHRALILARELSYPHSLAFALNLIATVHYFRGETQAAQERAEAAITLCSEQGFLQWLAHGSILRGWTLTEQKRAEEGIAQLRQGLATWQAIGAELAETFFLALLAEACGKVGQTEEGLSVVAEALAKVDKTGERFYEAELYRLYGELSLAQSSVQRLASSVRNPQSAIRNRKRRPKRAFTRPSRSPVSNKRSRWSYGRR